MNITKSEEFASYVNAAQEYYNLLEKASLKNNFSERPKPDKMDQLKRKCEIWYAENLKRHDDYRREYFKDIKSATQNNNFYLLMVLIGAQTELPLLSSQVDIFLLNYLADYFKKENENELHVWFAKYLFEQILDTAETGLAEYIEVINKIFSLDVPMGWYSDFYDQAGKLIARAPISKETFFAVKNGLKNTSREIEENIKEYIFHLYVKEGLADKEYNWI